MRPIEKFGAVMIVVLLLYGAYRQGYQDAVQDIAVALQRGPVTTGYSMTTNVASFECADGSGERWEPRGDGLCYDEDAPSRAPRWRWRWFR